MSTNKTQAAVCSQTRVAVISVALVDDSNVLSALFAL